MGEVYNHEEVRFEDVMFRVYFYPAKQAYVLHKEHTDSFFFHEQVEIKYFYEGTTTLVVGAETIVVNAGDVVVINPYEFHSTIATNGGKYHLFMVDLDFFTKQNFDTIDLRHIFMKKKICFKHLISGDERIRQIVANIVRELSEKKEKYKIVVHSSFCEFFVLLLRSYIDYDNINVVIDEKVKYYEMIEPAIRMIMTNYSSRIGLQELSTLCNMCKYHFCRIFKLATGMTPLGYLTEYRLKNADVLLGNTTKSISVIASACGFEDAAYFSRCYKKSRGISPKDNRQILSKKLSIDAMEV